MAGSGDPLAQLRQGDPGPLYFIYGKERFLVDRAVDLVREKALDPRTRDFNYELLYGKEAGASRILQAARTLPMMAKRRLILVRDADEMKADELAGLIPYLSNPAPETCLVFVGEKIDQRIKFFTEFKKKGVLIKLDPLYERQLPGFVRDEARLKSVSFEAGAAELLSDEIGADLGQLADAVERLAIYVGDRKRIGVEDVEAAVSGGRQRNIFELGNAVGQGRRGDALRFWDRCSRCANRRCGSSPCSLAMSDNCGRRRSCSNGERRATSSRRRSVCRPFSSTESSSRRADSTALK